MNGPEYLSQVPEKEFECRLEKVRDRTGDVALFFDATSIEYLTGFDHIQTERPVALAIDQERVEITVPRLEVERVESNDIINEVHHYFDYPQGKPVETVAEMIRMMGAERVEADMDGAPGVMGYEGPPLSDFVDVKEQSWVSEMRKAKSDVEIELIRESARWGNVAHEHLVDLVEEGEHPVNVSQKASVKASRDMLEALGDEYAPRTRGDGPAKAGMISGRQTALPHGHNDNRKLELGDVMITFGYSNVDGYFSELERTMFVAEYSERQRELFELMKESQDIAIEACGPGVPLEQVAGEVWNYYQEQGVTGLARHHFGHNIGMEGHEPPFIDRGSEAEMEPGHLYTIEPGLYTDSEGYRHSDTILITESGTETITFYPRDIDSNTVG